jgi:GT2 family glycosyltransferase
MNSVTVAVVPRERFSEAKASFDSIREHTPASVPLIYVDGRSPLSVRRYLAAQAERHPFRLIRSDRYLSPNQARNLALREVTTEYVVFIDNDVLVTPGWLDALVNCADDTGASIVGPMYYAGERGTRNIHMAGGTVRIEEENGRRVLHEHHRYARQERDDIGVRFAREQVELVEFHCMLVRMDVFRAFGPLDEQLLSTLEHVDLCLTVLGAGGTVFFEPAAEVTHLMPPPFAFSDYPYFMLRWSDAWNRASIKHFQRKWALEDDDPSLRQLGEWLGRHRQRYFKPAWNVVYPVLGWRRSNGLERALTRSVAALLE